MKHALHQMRFSFRDAAALFVGALCQSIAYAVFIAPAKIVPGGVYGLSITLNHMTQGVWNLFPGGVPIGVIAILFNIPLFLLATRKLGLSSGGKTIATFVSIALMTDLIGYFTHGKALVENDPFLASVYGGVILGIGVFLTFRAGSTSAGTDVLARILGQGRNIKTSTLLISIDSLVVLFGLLSFGDWKIPLYSWITIFVYGKVVEQFMPEQPHRALMIVSEKIEPIRQKVLEMRSLRGTLVEGKGIYSDQKRQILLMIAERKEVPAIRRMVLDIDSEAFITSIQASNDTSLKPL